MKEISDTLLSLKNISKNYVNLNSELKVLKNFSLTIKKGEFVSVLGPSGCGKSTVLKICSSMIPQDSGIVSVFGKTVKSPDKNRVLMLQDDNQLFPWLTVEKNVAFSIRGTELPGTESTIKNLLDMSELTSYAKYYPHQLSGGMKKRTALARALAGNPKILLMDEPFGSLDAKIKDRLQNFLLAIWEKYKMTILFVTHDINEAIRLGQRIIIMNNSGEIVCDEKNTAPKNSTLSEDNFFKLYRKYYTLLTDSGRSPEVRYPDTIASDNVDLTSLY